MDINNLPFEILEKILRELEAETLVKMRSVCKSWKEMIDENECIWREKCREQFKFSSQIAKRKCAGEMKWSQIYKNIKMWSNFSQFDRHLRKFYNFSMHDKKHSLDIEYNILPLKEANGMTLYDMTTLKYIPVALPEKNCLKISCNNIATAILIKSSILLQRTVENKAHTSELLLKADGFVLEEYDLYYYNNRDVYKLDLRTAHLEPELLSHIDFDIKEIQHSDKSVHLFTDCGKILTIDHKKRVKRTIITCPDEWIKRIKHVTLLDNLNYICYSRNLFQIQTEDYHHIYLDYPTITAMFFYGEVILLGTRAGELLLYRMSSQKRGQRVTFEKLAVLPEQKFAVKLDVYERSTGPLIVVTTYLELFLLEVTFFPEVRVMHF